MSHRSLLTRLKRAFAATPSRPAARRLRLEALEERTLPSFLAPVNYPVGATPGAAVVTADFNGDGRVDLAVHRAAGANPVGVLLGNGDGTFQAVRNAAAGTSWGGPGSLAVGDFNADGRPDLATANDDGTVSVLLGNGDGTFAAPRTLVLADQTIALSVTAGDFDADGRLDLAVGAVFVGISPEEPSLYVYPGNGDGTFASPRLSLLPPAADYNREPYSVQAADLNGDGRLDVVTANFDNTVTVLLGNGDGTLQAPTLYSAGPAPMMTLSVAVADLNGDGKPDLATADYNGTNGTLSVLLGDGTGAFPAYRTYAAGDSPSSVAVADVNGDGRRDLITTNSGGNTVNVLLGVGDGTFRAARNYYAGASPFAVAAGAFNGDAFPDLAVVRTGSTAGSLAVFLNDGDWSPAKPPGLSITDVARQEGKKGQTTQFVFTVMLEFASDQPITVSFKTVDGTATVRDGDYVARTGTLTFQPGETTKTVTIVVNGDAKKEADETFYVDLFGNSSNSVLSRGRGTGTILNDD
jgi:hypothetical protein